MHFAWAEGAGGGGQRKGTGGMCPPGSPAHDINMLSRQTSAQAIYNDTTNLKKQTCAAEWPA